MHILVIPSAANSDMEIGGWVLLKHFPPFRYFPNFSELSKHILAIEYHVYVCIAAA